MKQERIYILDVRLAIAVPEGADPESHAAETANEILRPFQRCYAESPKDETDLLDYSIGGVEASDAKVEGYKEGDF